MIRTICDPCLALVEAAPVETRGALGDGAVCAVCGAPEGHGAIVPAWVAELAHRARCQSPPRRYLEDVAEIDLRGHLDGLWPAWLPGRREIERGLIDELEHEWLRYSVEAVRAAMGMVTA